jgi:hypothetical protein
LEGANAPPIFFLHEEFFSATDLKSGKQRIKNIFYTNYLGDLKTRKNENSAFTGRKLQASSLLCAPPPTPTLLAKLRL